MGELLSEGLVRTPASALRPFVESYRGYRLEGHPAGVHHGVPSRHLPFMLSFDRPVVTTGEQGTAARWAFAGGLHDSAATIVHDGNQHGMAIQVTPMGARLFFGLPAGALGGTVVDLEELFGAYARELYDRAAAAPTWDARFAVLDDVLTKAARRRLDDPPEPPSEVVRAWRRLVATGGGVEIGGLAAEVGWSRRHAELRPAARLLAGSHLSDAAFDELLVRVGALRTEAMQSPPVHQGLDARILERAAPRVLRFERARHLLGLPTRPGLAAVAVACGYYDQAHFTREWNELAGCTPTRWIADELPSMQDGE